MNPNMNQDMMEKVRKFMQGRYGPDQLGNAVLLLGFICMIADLFARTKWLTLAGIVCVIICYVRLFSRNFTRRYKENQMFLKVWNPVMHFLKKGKRIISARIRTLKDKNYKYFVCPKCITMIRIPKGKGKIAITCKNCKKQFKGRT